MFPRVLPVLAGAVVIGLLAACAPQTAAERAYFEEKQAEKDARDSLRSKLTESSLKDADIIGMVSSNAAPDAVGTMDDWLKRQLGQMDGQIMFPRWKVLRHGTTKYEVQYAFSIIDGQNHLAKRGYQWNVDAMIKQVGPPRELTFAEQSIPLAPSLDKQQRRRIRDEESSLE